MNLSKQFGRMFLVTIFMITLFVPTIFASHTRSVGFSEDFDFKIFFVDEEDNEWEISGEIDNRDIVDLKISIEVDEFDRDDIDDVDIDIDSDSFDASLNETDNEIRTRSNTLIIDLGSRNTADFDLRDRIDIRIRAEDEDGESERFDFSLAFDVDDDEFEMKIDGLDSDIIEGTVEVVIDNERFDHNDRELEIRERGDDEVRIVVEDFFDLDFDRGDLRRDFDKTTGRTTRNSFRQFSTLGNQTFTSRFTALPKFVPFSSAAFAYPYSYATSGYSYSGDYSNPYNSYLSGYYGAPSYYSNYSLSPFYTTTNFYNLTRPNYFANSGFYQYN